MTVRFLVIILLVVSNLFPGDRRPVREYDLGDWISIKNFNYITSLTESYNYIYFGSTGGILPYHKTDRVEEVAFTVSDGMADDFVTAVYYDESTQYLWAGHRLGVSFLSPTAERWENCITYNYPANRIERIGSNRNFIFVRLTDGNLLTLDSQSGMKATGNTEPKGITWNKSAMSDNVTIDESYLANGQYWVRNDGIIQDHELREFPWNLKYVNTMGEIYGGVFGLGYITGDENMKKINIHSSGILKNYVNTFWLTDRYLWVGSQDDYKERFNERTGISYYDYEKEKWQYFEDKLIPELATGKVTDIVFENNHLILGTEQGVSTYDMEDKRWRRFSVHDGLYDDLVHSVAIYDTLALIGTDFGLNVLNLSTWELSRLSLTKSKSLLRIHKIVPTDENIWVGTNNGFYSIKMPDKSIIHYDSYGREIKADKVLATNCFVITADSNNVALRGDNFFLYYNGKKWQDLPNYDQKSVVLDMALSGNYLWLGTGRGANLMNIKTGEIERYGVADGLAGAKVMEVLFDHDWVWFGTDQGLTKYNWRKYVLE